jgi:hypothetical protein
MVDLPSRKVTMWEDNQILDFKRLEKERLGRRCAYAWECGADKKSRMGERCRRRKRRS